MPANPVHLQSIQLVLLAALVAFAAGCTGLPEGSADFGDTVTVRYSATDGNGTVLRTERTATFVLGSGASGLGLGFERGLRGQMPGENATFIVDDDPSLRFGETVEVPRALQPIPMHQDAPRRDFEANVGPATVGQQFPAFGIYTATVTGLTASRVNFTIDADPMQEDPVPSVGAILVSDPDGTNIQRSLKPNVGATFVINPPTQGNPQTPLGLSPGGYRTVGATADKIQYSFSVGSAADLIGKEVHFTVTIVRLTPGDHAVGPVDGNYAVRDSPYLKGDPDAVLQATPTTDEGHEEDDHAH